MDDAQIVSRILTGNISDFRELVDRYQRPIYRFVANLIGNQHDAEDITQEVFVSAYRNLSSYDAGKAALITWLFTIARNRSVNHLKQRRPAVAVTEADELEAAIDRGGAASSIDKLERREFWRQLDKALMALPVAQRVAFVLAEIEQLPYARIAEIEQTTLGTVKSRIHRAKQSLRETLDNTLRESK